MANTTRKGGPHKGGKGAASKRRRFATAVGIILILLLELDLLYLLRIHVFDNSQNILTATPGWVFGLLATVSGLALLLVALQQTRRNEEKLGTARETMDRLDRLTEAVLEQRNMRDLLDTVAVRIRDVVEADDVSLFIVNDVSDRLVHRAEAESSQERQVVTNQGTRPFGGMAPPLPSPSDGPGLDEEVLFGQGLVGLAAERGRVVAEEVPPSTKGWLHHAYRPKWVEAPAPKKRAFAVLALACPMIVDGRVTGVVRVRFDEPVVVGHEQVELLEEAAGRVARAIEGTRLYEAELRSRLAAEHARTHVAIVAAASELFDSALGEYEPSLRQLADLLVPSFADWCLIEFAGPAGSLKRLANQHVDPLLRDSFGRISGAHRGWTGPLRRVASSGEAELRYGLLSPQERVTDFVAVMRELHIESTVVLPIRVRGLSLGTIVLGRGPERRGFRPSDRAAGEEVARRVALAIERVMLYRENREAADQAREHADRLHRLMMAAPEITSPLSSEAVLDVLVEQAQHVLDAERVVVTLPRDGVRMSWPPAPANELASDDIVRYVEQVLTLVPNGDGAADADTARSTDAMLDDEGRRLSTGQTGTLVPPADRTSWLAVYITGAGLRTPGAIIVSGRAHPFSGQDEAILASMAQLAAAALANARLYHTVETNEERLRTLVGAAPLAILEIDLHERVRRWNRAAEDMFGWPSFDDTRLNNQENPAEFPPSLAREIHALFRQASVGELSKTVEVSGAGPDGPPFELSAVAAPLRDGLGKVNGVLCVITDVSERKDLEARLLVSQRMEAIGRLAGGVAHDFNNLLTVIMGYSNLVLRKLPDDDPVRPDLEAIATAGEQAAVLTSQLLAIGRHQVTQKSVVSITEIVGSIEEVLRRLVSEDIAVDMDLEPGWLLIDPGHIEQVLLNLVVNASDAMPEGGRLTVRCRQETLEHPLEVATNVIPPGTWVTITVEDTGTGMDPEVLAHCFEPFYTTKDRSKGTGLGLATVFGIVDQHGGHIRIESTVGAGTAVTVYLPALADIDDFEDEESEPPDWLPRGCEYVLVVEDQDALRQFTTEVLRSQGYMTLEAANAEEALEVARNHREPLDLLVTDVIMPGMDGAELARKMREVIPELPVLYVSGYSGDARRALNELSSGANFLAKPFTAEDLTSRVRELLDESARTEQDVAEDDSPSKSL